MREQRISIAIIHIVLRHITSSESKSVSFGRESPLLLSRLRISQRLVSQKNHCVCVFSMP